MASRQSASSMMGPKPLPYAAAHPRWSYREGSELGEHGNCSLTYGVGVWGGNTELPATVRDALPLLFHEFDQQPGLEPVLVEAGRRLRAQGHARNPSPKSMLRRLVLRLVSFRYSENDQRREYIFRGQRPSSLHLLSRVFETRFRFWLEDLSHFATQGAFLLEVLDTVGIPNGIDPEAILYAPAVDALFPFKFALVGSSQQYNEEAYVGLLRSLLQQTEADETFCERNFRALMQNFSKFGPASATPEFQEVELKMWALLGYLAARLRVKAGRLTDARSLEDKIAFLGELDEIHDCLEDLIHLPSRLAALFRNRFDQELVELPKPASQELDAMARRVDADPVVRLPLDEKARLLSKLRGLRISSPLENMLEKDRDIKLAYGDCPVPEIEKGWVRRYREEIFTGATRFDPRRFQASGEMMIPDIGEEEEDLELDVKLNFGFGAEPGASMDDSSTELDLDLEWGV